MVRKPPTDEGVPQLTAYVGAIYNVKDKDISFLACQKGYLVYVDRRGNPFCLWLPQPTAKTILKLAFGSTQDKAETFLQSVLANNQLLQGLGGRRMNNPSSSTLVFSPEHHLIQYGSVETTKSPTYGPLQRPLTAVSELLGLTKSQASEERKKQEPDVVVQTFLRFVDRVTGQAQLEKKRVGEDLVGLEGVVLRTIYVEEGALFLKKMQKRFSCTFVGEKP